MSMLGLAVNLIFQNNFCCEEVKKKKKTEKKITQLFDDGLWILMIRILLVLSKDTQKVTRYMITRDADIKALRQMA